MPFKPSVNFQPHAITQGLLLTLGVWGLLALQGCTDTAPYNPAISQLNTSAQQALQKGDTDSAIHRLESALELAPNDVNTQYNLAIVYQSKGNHLKAISLLEKLLKTKEMSLDKLLPALAVAYEAEADRLSNLSSPQASPQGSKPDLSAQEQAMHYYQKAIETFEQCIQEIKPGQPEWGPHLQLLKQSLKKHPDSGSL
jgi:tetratricopeptide (TPR) repeat protein